MGFLDRLLGREKTEEPAAPVEAEDIPAAEAEETDTPKAAEKQEEAEPEKPAISDPEAVFSFFREICAIPHGSFHTKEISDHLVRFAQYRGLEYTQDEADNVVIRCPASEGCEVLEPLILQGHMDMVLAKEEDREIDMVNEAITVIEEGDWIRADGTTLGGDNGIAVAMMLAILDDRKIPHPPLECVFTANEEVGMLGAAAMDMSGLRGRRMLNLDSEEEGVITAGCAGGARVNHRIPVRMKNRQGWPVTVKVSGLQGGHSGEMIRLGRPNAVLLLGRVLYELSKTFKFRILSIKGGIADNAIPTSAQAQILFPMGDEEKRNFFVDSLRELERKARVENEILDPALKIECPVGKEPVQADVFTYGSTKRILEYLMIVPNGVIAFSPSFDKLPQTSLNLGVLRTTEDSVEASFLIRSSIGSQKEMIISRLNCIAKLFDAESITDGDYPAWEYRTESPFRDKAAEIYERQTGTPPVIQIIHAGLECGMFSDGIEGLECISIGPDLKDIHTPAEKLSKPSTIRLWRYVLALLEELSKEAKA